MAAFKATPKLPWDISEGGLIKLKGITVTMQQLVDGLITFDVINSHGETVTGRVVQYPSDQKYYIQADGSILWQVGDISEPTDTLVISASQTVQSGFTLTDVHVSSVPVRIGYYMSGDDPVLAVLMSDGSKRGVRINGGVPFGYKNENEDVILEFSPSPLTSQNVNQLTFLDNVDWQLGFDSLDFTPVIENDFLNVKWAGYSFRLYTESGLVSPVSILSTQIIE